MAKTAKSLNPKLNTLKTNKSPKKSFFILLTLFFVILLFCALEVFLRIFQYGPNLSLFTIETIHGKAYYTMNPDIKYRYFSQVDFSPITSPEYFLTTKPADTYRIFCLGASTTVGFPYWYNASFPSFLRDRLQYQFPNKKIEIINLGLTATNSYTVVDIARELSEYEPNLIIVYDGHNEFYGALGISSRETLGSSRWIAKTYLRLIHVRIFQLMRNVISNITSSGSSPFPTQERGTMMERLARGKYIPYGSETYNNALSIFKENLNELQTICADKSIPLMVSSQASNLRGLRPFISGEYPGSSATDRQRYQTKFDKSVELFNAGKVDSAIANLHNLLPLDSARADIYYFLGRCYEKKHNFTEASNAYIHARDYDQLRFRASSDFNNMIRLNCKKENEIFVDIEQLFKENSPDSLIGNELIVEHLHPNVRGYFLMAKEYARMMREHQLFATTQEWKNAKSIDENELWQNRHVTEFDERLAARKTEALTSAWPFTQSSSSIIPSIKGNDTLENILENVTRGKLNWIEGHQQTAQYYLLRGEKVKAAKEFETIISQAPNEVNAYLQVAHIYLELGEIEKVKNILTSSLSVQKTILAYRALGDIALNQNKPLLAVSYYAEMSHFDQSMNEKLQNGYLLALAQSRSGDTEIAQNQLLMLLQIKSDYAPAQELLAKISKK